MSALAATACESPPNGEQTARQITFNVAFDPVGCSNRGITSIIAQETKAGAPPKWALVNGVNQNGQNVTWQGPYNPATGIVTTNWYWVGAVSVLLESGSVGSKSWGGQVALGWVPPKGDPTMKCRGRVIPPGIRRQSGYLAAGAC